MRELTPSAYMVLAMIRDGYDTGYRIKQYLERAASFFWSVSYGQIYPELRRLEAAGLVTGRDLTSTGRRRREYSLTASGRPGAGAMAGRARRAVDLAAQRGPAAVDAGRLGGP